MIRTDLALEIAEKSNVTDGVLITKGCADGINFSRVDLDSEGGKKLGKAPGSYLTIFCPGISDEKEINAIAELLSPFIPKRGRAVIAGLGNENITPDCLGVRTVQHTAATAHLAALPDFRALSMREVFVLETGVLAQTGMESAVQLKYICDGIKPCVVVVIDSLSCLETEKLGKTVQISDGGIAPGSGVKNARSEISQKTLGVPVIAVGVPTVADSRSVLGREEEALADTMIVPRNIDVMINRFAKIISKAINRVMNPGLSDGEIEQLLV